MVPIMLPKHLPTKSASQEPLSEAPPERIGPTPERLAQARSAGDDAVTYIATEEAVAVPRMLDGNVLDLLLSRGVIDSEEYACGAAFFRHWYYSGLASAGVIPPGREKVDGGEFRPPAEVALWHLQKWRRMTLRLGPIHSLVLSDCLLSSVPLVDFGLRHCRTTSRKIARERAQDRLVSALMQLVIHELGARHTRSRAHVGERPGILPAGHDGEWD